MKIKDIIKGVIISVSAIVIGYLAVGLPLNLFNLLSKDGQRIFFIVELCLYLFIGAVFLVIQDRKEQQLKKEQIRHEKRKEKIKTVQENWYDLVA
ncbi:hypothetical protein [Eubacterium sp.]|uniref:hypothetical protein n=1 Tax=Eubacterium sp. TaxID=142586 RepID=UPI002A7F939F|nr:hypothetical protein [Eubacterium sp.]MDY3812635.1 hypothetical protein [Eubacterium sp.]